MIGTSYSFWSVSYVKNDMDFAVLAFLSRFFNGIGSGMLRSVILIAKAQGMKQSALQAEDHFRFHLQGESLGYLLGPLLIVITTRDKLTRNIFLWLAVF